MSNSKEDLNATNSYIVFEAADFDRSLELLLFAEKCGDRFQLHIWNAETDEAVVMDLTSDDVERLSSTFY